jgi:hypothetical protein
MMNVVIVAILVEKKSENENNEIIVKDAILVEKKNENIVKNIVLVKK